VRKYTSDRYTNKKLVCVLLRRWLGGAQQCRRQPNQQSDLKPGHVVVVFLTAHLSASGQLAFATALTTADNGLGDNAVSVR
jgi:hypothetical protein